MRTLVVLPFALFVASCMLLVSPDTYGDHCRFTGEESQCGSCVTTHCRAEVDACCRDTSCDGRMTLLDTCAAKHDASCNDLPKGNDSLATCIARECGAVCVELKGASLTTCREPRLAPGSICTCEVASTAGNDFVCSNKSYPDTICCAPKGYPAPGLACSCRPLNCVPNDEGCFCNLADDATPARRECSTATCCVGIDTLKDTCRCIQKDCSTAERKVAACTLSEIDCGEGQIRLDSCSVRVD